MHFLYLTQSHWYMLFKTFFALQLWHIKKFFTGHVNPELYVEYTSCHMKSLTCTILLQLWLRFFLIISVKSRDFLIRIKRWPVNINKNTTSQKLDYVKPVTFRHSLVRFLSTRWVRGRGYYPGSFKWNKVHQRCVKCYLWSSIWDKLHKRQGN